MELLCGPDLETDEETEVLDEFGSRKAGCCGRVATAAWAFVAAVHEGRVHRVGGAVVLAAERRGCRAAKASRGAFAALTAARTARTNRKRESLDRESWATARRMPVS